VTVDLDVGKRRDANVALSLAIEEKKKMKLFRPQDTKRKAGEKEGREEKKRREAMEESERKRRGREERVSFFIGTGNQGRHSQISRQKASASTPQSTAHPMHYRHTLTTLVSEPAPVEVDGGQSLQITHDRSSLPHRTWSSKGYSRMLELIRSQKVRAMYRQKVPTEAMQGTQSRFHRPGHPETWVISSVIASSSPFLTLH
jgi:hypothetical protein